MYKVHFLTAVEKNGSQGWIAPVELGVDQPQDGRLVIPVPVAHSGLFESYCLEYAIHQGIGQFTARSVAMDRQKDNSLKVTIEGQDVVFVQRRIDGQPLELPYVGQLTHGDFAKLLCEIEPSDPTILDDLYDKSQVIVAGCDPEIEYQGLGQLLAIQGHQRIS